jgi:endogenous inhibitor of DNA gyrase (YacG/DUF329 family)
MPFCSDRCRQIDLGRWLSEKYALPEVKRQDAAPPDQTARTDLDEQDRQPQ